MPWPTWGRECHPDSSWSIFFNLGCILLPTGASKGTKIRQKSMFWGMWWGMWCPRSSHMNSGAKLHKMVIDVGMILAQLRCPKWSKNIALYFAFGFYLSSLFRVPSFSGSTTCHAVVKQLLYQEYVLSSRGPNFALKINVLSVPLPARFVRGPVDPTHSRPARARAQNIEKHEVFGALLSKP